MQWRSLWLLVGLLWLSNAWCITAAEQLSEILRNLHTLQASFTQQIQDQQGQTLQQSMGTMALQRPGKFRWATTAPNQQLIIADGKTLWIDDEDLQQVTPHPQSSAKNSPGLLLSAAPADLIKQFQIVRLADQPMAFTLTPRHKQAALFASVTLYFDQQAGLSQMLLQDNLNQQTQINFSHVKLNQPLAKQLFIFSKSDSDDK